jgi:methyl-accepting chemotaxis protein WspA
MRAWSIRRLIVASFGAILALMIVMTALAYMRLLRIDREAASVRSASIPALADSSAIADRWSDDFLITEVYVSQLDLPLEQSAEGRILTSRTELDGLIASYEASSGVDDPQAVRAFETFKAARAIYAKVQDDVMAAARDPKRHADAALKTRTDLAPQFERAQAAIATVVQLTRAASEVAAQRIALDVSATKTASLVILAIALGLAAICGFGLLRAITRPLGALGSVVDVMGKGDFRQRVALDRQDEIGLLADGFNKMTDALTMLVGQVQKSGVQVNTSVTEIAATAKEQQATANEVAATTAEIGATSREIAATSKELVKTMHEISSVTEQSAALAGHGQAGLTQMEETIGQVMEAAGSVTGKLATLNEKARDISQVVTTITKVADQTNLLSLNAAIEAEKAGEYGRGFAVVATEIRRLADQTAVATYDIDQMVKAIQSAVSAGVMSMDKFSEEVRRGRQVVQDVSGLLSQVIQQVQALAPRVEAVTDGMQAQATGAEQITEALVQLSEAARQTVESLRQSSQAIDELNQVSVELRTGVAGFMTQIA